MTVKAASRVRREAYELKRLWTWSPSEDQKPTVEFAPRLCSCHIICGIVDAAYSDVDSSHIFLISHNMFIILKLAEGNQDSRLLYTS